LNDQVQPQWDKKSRKFVHLLIWSGALNIGLLSSLVYFVFQDRREAISFEKPPIIRQQEVSTQEILQSFSTLSWADLVAHLENREAVQAGYTKRDLALATLSAFHSFDIERAIQEKILHRHTIAFRRKEGPEEVYLTVYPSLTDEQFLAIRRFIQTEKFPLTSEGLFYEIQQAHFPRDASLLQTFYLTPEFTALLTLFQRVGLPLPKEALVEMVAQGDWPTLHTFAEEEKWALDLSPERLRRLLDAYVRCRSPLAVRVLAHLEQKVEKKVQVEQVQVQETVLQQPPKEEKRHTVQKGENLWKISRKYKVSIDALREANHLTSDKIREGKTLVIP